MDYTRLNIQDREGRWLCPACGFPGYFRGYSYADWGGLAGSGICPCCFFEPGFDDSPLATARAEPTILASILKYRSEWIAGGMKWVGDPKIYALPDNWNPEHQLEVLWSVFPDFS